MIIVRKITQNCINLIKYYERFVDHPYLCPAGYWTIAWGHLIRPGETFTIISRGEGEVLLHRDLLQSQVAGMRLIQVPLEDYQWDAIVSFIFNLGGGAFQRSTMRMKINREEHYLVPNEFRKWIFGGGRKLPGLIKRRNTEALLYDLAELYFNGPLSI